MIYTQTSVKHRVLEHKNALSNLCNERTISTSQHIDAIRAPGKVGGDNTMSTAFPRAPARAPIALPNGRIVTFTRVEAGYQNATMADGGDMSESEWEQLCALIPSTPRSHE